MLAIGELEVGGHVLAYDEETGELAFYPVTAVWVHQDLVVVLLTIDGETIETTPEHPFYTTKDQWLPAGDLLAGDQVQKADGSFGTVEAVAFVHQPQAMYNLTVADAHTFFVGDGQWLVHNKCRITAPLSREARDALRAEARDIWEEVTGRRAWWDNRIIHHRIPLEWAHLFPDADPNRVANLVAMTPDVHQLFNNAWTAFRTTHRNSTATEVMKEAMRLDKLYGHLMTFAR